jgi:diadenosine tetraphosphate (Ap4A) HIT family hydrolase
MTCELCERDGGELLWRDPRCRVVLVPEPGYPGYCRVIWNAHVREMTDLGERDPRPSPAGAHAGQIGAALARRLG